MVRAARTVRYRGADVTGRTHQYVAYRPPLCPDPT